MACLHVSRWILLVLKSEKKNNVQVQRDFRFVLMPAYQLLASLMSVSILLEMFIPGVGSKVLVVRGERTVKITKCQ